MSANACAASSGNAGLPAALPADLLHGIALRPPELAWDGTRYRGSQLLGARLAEVRTLAGVVATVQHMPVVGVVAVSPRYARQAAADLAPVWQAAHAAETPRSGPPDADRVRYGLRLPSRVAAGLHAGCPTDTATRAGRRAATARGHDTAGGC
ncbi:hypothetical protein G6F62_014333 [Rhizopus arrhizus]|nr:hypothetical protein G6F62_014333 [Rhizopus arrhizus]